MQEHHYVTPFLLNVDYFEFKDIFLSLQRPERILTSIDFTKVISLNERRIPENQWIQKRIPSKKNKQNSWM